MSEPFVIFHSIRGSRAAGIATEKSDIDHFKIVIPPTEALIGLGNMKGSQHQDRSTGEDTRIVTLKEFLRQALNGRSTELECIFCRGRDILDISPHGEELLKHRNRLVSRKLFSSLLGFASGQQKRMLRGNSDRFRKDLGVDPKSAAHGLRALWQAIQLKRTGKLKLFIDSNFDRNLILSIKNGNVNRTDVQRCVDEFEEILESTPLHPEIPEVPDYKFWNNFLIRVHKARIEQKV